MAPHISTAGELAASADRLVSAAEADEAVLRRFTNDPVGTFASFGAVLPPLTPEIAAGYEKYLREFASEIQRNRGTRDWSGSPSSVACISCVIGLTALITGAIATAGAAVVTTQGLAAPAIVTAVVGWFPAGAVSYTAVQSALLGLGTGGVTAAIAAVGAVLTQLCDLIPGCCSPADYVPPQAGSNENDWTRWSTVKSSVYTVGGGPITVAQRDPMHLDLFMAGTDGQVWTISWGGQEGWGDWHSLDPNIRTAPGGQISAVYRDPDHLEVFLIGSDGFVYWISWSAFDGWSPKWRNTGGPGKPGFQPGGMVNVARRGPGHLDLLVAAPEMIYMCMLDPSYVGGLSPWQSAGGMWTTVGHQIAAVYRDASSHLQLFLTGTDGQIWTTSFDPRTTWGRCKWSHVNDNVRPPAGAPITAVYRDSTHLDLFVAGTDGQVWNIAWDQTQGWAQDWNSIVPNVRTTGGGPITAVYRNPDHLDLFMTGTDGTVWNISWNRGTGWQSGWSTIHSNVRSKGGSRVAAVWADLLNANLFVAGTNGWVWNSSYVVHSNR